VSGANSTDGYDGGGCIVSIIAGDMIDSPFDVSLPFPLQMLFSGNPVKDKQKALGIIEKK